MIAIAVATGIAVRIATIVVIIAVYVCHSYTAAPLLCSASSPQNNRMSRSRLRPLYRNPAPLKTPNAGS